MVSSATKTDTTTADPDPTSLPATSRTSELWFRIGGWVRSESLLLAVLAGSFLARFLVAERSSYWLDEMYSVAIYGIWNDTAIDAVRHLAETSVHPPLYQFILFYWMDWFGDSELATRSLSNLYITLATLFLYLAVRVGFSRRIALTSAVAFTLMYTPMFYGLETRSYAQSIFLVTLSSYLLLRILRTAADRGWRLALVSPTGSMFTVVNAALLLTHYFNAFFWAAQALVAGIFVLRERPPKQWPAGAGVLTAIYGLQATIFLGVWGRILLNDFGRRAGDFAVEGADELRSPFEMLLNSVVLRNIDPPRLIAWAGVALGAAVVVGAIAVLFRQGTSTSERRQAWMVVYLVSWLVLPLVIVYLAFLTTGVARYSHRYFVYSVVPLTPLLVLTVEKGARLVERLLRRIRGIASHHSWAIMFSVVVIAALIIPGTYAAVTEPKADWRGGARTIVDIIESNPEASYLVYELSFRQTPVLNYYLARYSDEVRVTNTIRRSEERRGGDFSFERDADLIAEHDYLIIPFIHHRTTNFPIALERLSEAYEIHHWQVDHRGRGLAIFSVSGDV